MQEIRCLRRRMFLLRTQFHMKKVKHSFHSQSEFRGPVLKNSSLGEKSTQHIAGDI